MKIRIATGGALLALVVNVAGVSAAVSASAPTAKTDAKIDAKTDLRLQGPNDTSLAVDVLQTIRVENEYTRGYKRSLFKHWLDIDGDGCDAREQVLKRDAVGFAQVDPFRCFVVEADWLSPYDGRRTTDRTSVDIDHTVALKEAWDSGAWQWSEAQRTAYANDTSDSRTLIAVSSSSNRSKSDRDPSNWMPPLRGYWCTYSANWIAVKARWNLSMDQSEWGRLNNLLTGQCAGTTLRGWNPPSVGTSPAVTVSTTVPAAVSTTVPAAVSTTVPAIGSRATTTTVASSGATSTSTTTSTSIAGGAPAVAPRDITPGAYCAPVDALGTYKSRTYVCSKTNQAGEPYSNGRARWRQL